MVHFILKGISHEDSCLAVKSDINSALKHLSHRAITAKSYKLFLCQDKYMTFQEAIRKLSNR